MRPALRGAACVSFGGYLVWNVYWLSHRRLPPSMLLGLFGLPAPTTGCTRSLCCLLKGDWAGSLFWNAFLLPLLLLLVISLVHLARSAVMGSRLVIPPIMGRLWLGTLLLAWAAKLVQGRNSW